MASDSDEVQAVTDRVHDNSWSANLELEQYGADRALLIEHANEAVRQTTAGHHVNLVTHKNHGHPEEYLVGPLSQEFYGIEMHYVEQCGCGGHVFRVKITE